MINAEEMRKMEEDIGMTPWGYVPTIGEWKNLQRMAAMANDYIAYVAKKYEMPVNADPLGLKK